MSTLFNKVCCKIFYLHVFNQYFLEKLYLVFFLHQSSDRYMYFYFCYLIDVIKLKKSHNLFVLLLLFILIFFNHQQTTTNNFFLNIKTVDKLLITVLYKLYFIIIFYDTINFKNWF